VNQPLIFTERRLLPRIIDVLLTLIAWVGFLYLIYKGLITALAHSPYMGVRPFFTTLDTVTFYILVALVNGLVLIGWAKYNQFRLRVERRSRRPGLEDHELADNSAFFIGHPQSRRVPPMCDVFVVQCISELPVSITVLTGRTGYFSQFTSHYTGMCRESH